MFAYSRAAIDWWPGWLTEVELKKQLVEIHSTEDAAHTLLQYEKQLSAAHELAKKVGWEGDTREGPYIAGLPAKDTADDGHYMIAWKQDNNGDTFVVSPFRLPWLEDGNYGEWIEG